MSMDSNFPILSAWGLIKDCLCPVLSEEGGLGQLRGHASLGDLIQTAASCGTIFHLSYGVKGRGSQGAPSSVLISVPNG